MEDALAAGVSTTKAFTAAHSEHLEGKVLVLSSSYR